jgi:hypothetical protein
VELQKEGAGSDDCRQEAFRRMAFQRAGAGDSSCVGLFVRQARILDERGTIGEIVKREA